MAVARYKDYACKQGGKLMIAGEHLIAAIVCFKKKKKKKKNRTSGAKHMLESIGSGKCFKTLIWPLLKST